MYNSVLEYQKQYLKQLHTLCDFEGGYYTQGQDLEYFDANMIVIDNRKMSSLTNTLELLADSLYTTKIQITDGLLDSYDASDTISLIKYQHLGNEINLKLEIELVTFDNYSEYLKLSNALQIQEFGREYKSIANEAYLEQTNYQMYLIKYNQTYVGEFTYIPSLYAIESIIILSDYQRLGIMTNCFELITSVLNQTVFMSADNSSIGFYSKIDCQVIDKVAVNYLYGNTRNLLMYLSLSI